MKSITEIQNFEGKKALVRVDWNVPMTENGEVSDASRIENSLQTIEYIKNNGGTPVVMSHFGREGQSIQPVIDFAKKNYSVFEDGVKFLENLRMDKREEENDEEFARELAAKADIYVNDSFATSHREHASIVGVPKFLPSCAGINFMKEVKALSKAFDPEHPFLFILGGAKLETKLPLLQKFLNIADKVFVGGLLAAEASLNPDISQNPKVIFPVGDIKALDINQETIEVLKFKVKSSKFVLWNGPVGKYEDGYDWGTKELAKIINSSGVEAVIGGGDTESVIDEIVQNNPKIFLSTAGGAMLDFLVDGKLVGIEALG